MLKKNDLRFGLFLGFFAPIFGMLLYYFMRFFPTYSVKDFFAVLGAQTSLISAIASLSVFANVVFITLYLNKRKDKTAIGIFVATVVYGVASLLFKWFF
ncbi:MAG: hypothetical protein ACR2FN_06680 [Chitinophagaceae bacterium]